MYMKGAALAITYHVCLGGRGFPVSPFQNLVDKNNDTSCLYNFHVLKMRSIYTYVEKLGSVC